MNTRAINFVGGGAQNFREWFVFIGQKAPPGFPGSPYAINFKSSTPELSAMAPMNLSTYSCGDTSLGCSCGDCPSSPACSSPEPLPPPHEEDSCSFRIGPLKVRCIELSMALLYILLVSSFFGWAVFSRTRDITQPDGSSESLVRLLEGDGINSELKESTLGVKGKRHAHLSPVQRYMATFYKSYGSWIARNPSLVLFISVAIVLALSSGLLHFKVETRPEKLWVGPSSKAAEEKKFFDSHLSPFYRIEQLILATVPDPKTGRAPSLLTWLSLSFFTYTCQEERLSMVQSKNLTLYIFSSESSIEEELKRESTADVIIVAASYRLCLFIFPSLTFLLIRWAIGGISVVSGDLNIPLVSVEVIL
ncbi:NPC intracellular sterol transporter 1-related protein 1-like isoform X1 [Brassica napus]|uniref:NPC intracellular sterol transporter 1-related protein 1-like isoform X1 n=1 Tax=Brassica napus TaxID=3708 RepID=UPI002078F2A0|nr:NPC intracellular sterol transporter 1-related protein 1-like isoform X1 [Brassica napus]